MTEYLDGLKEDDGDEESNGGENESGPSEGKKSEGRMKERGCERRVRSGEFETKGMGEDEDALSSLESLQKSVLRNVIVVVTTSRRCMALSCVSRYLSKSQTESDSQLARRDRRRRVDQWMKE